MTDRLALPRRYRDQLEALLREHVPGVEVWAYGSRVNGESHDGSDLDLALRGPALEPLDGGFNDLLEAIEKSTIPILVQAHDWARLPESFHREIERDYVVVQEGAKQTAANSWREVALGDVAEIVMGQSPPGDKVSGDNGLALLNGPTEFGASHPTPVQFTIDARKYAQPGDILFCVRGSTTGRMNWADQEYAIGRGVAAIRHKNDSALQPFVRGVIELGLSELLAQATGSTFPNVSAQQLAEIPYPSLDEDEQRAIAHVLGTLDDKIELNRRMNRTLEEMARAIFQDWFVDFGPVRAKVEGQDPYLPPELWDLFPDRLVDSELGEIPEGWDVKPLGEISKAVKGRSYKSSQLADSDTALVTLKSFGRGGGYQPEGLKSFIGDYKPEQVVNPGEVIVACTDVTQAGRVIGHPALVEPDPKYRCLVASLDTIIVRPFDGNIGREFLYFLCGTESFINHTSAHSTGTTVLHLSKNAIPSYKMALPTQELLTQFRRVANSFLELRMKNRLETYNLADQRDALIPKLMSGEVMTGH